MKTFLTAFLISFAFLLVVTPILIHYGHKWGLVDATNRRTIHRGRIPRIGGIGIALGTILPLVLLYFYHNNVSEVFFQSLYNPLVVIGGGLLISGLGLLDDVKGVPARWKFLFQIALAVAAYYLGFMIDRVHTPWGFVEFGYFSLPLTILWIVGIINAFNLIDGMDGLSSGIAFFVSVTIFILALHNMVEFVALISAALAGAVVGFLVFNFNPAKIFMGDTGSMFIGFILAVLSLKGASKHSTLVSVLVPVVAMGVPILDTTLAFARRFLRNQPIFMADRQHIHHLLLSKGWNQRRVVMTLYAITVVFTALALFSMFLKDRDAFLILAVFSVLVIVIITKLGYLDILLSRYRVRNDDRLEHLLEETLVRQIGRLPLREMEDLIFDLPVKGFSVITAAGKPLFESGEKDPVNFLDLQAGSEHFLRLYWKGVVPSINTRESLMLSVVAKALLSYLRIEKKAAADLTSPTGADKLPHERSHSGDTPT